MPSRRSCRTAAFPVPAHLGQTPENSGVFLGSLDAKPEEQDSRQMLATLFALVYAPSAERGPGYLLIFREGNVWRKPSMRGGWRSWATP